MQKKSKFNMFTFMMLIILGLTFQPAISAYADCPEEISLYWKLDETAGPDYADFIKGIDGAGSVDPAATTGQINGAQEFDGATTGIDVPEDRSFSWFVDDSFSIEFWVKRNGAVTGDNQVAIGRSAGDPAASLIWWAGIGGDNDGTVNQNAASFVLGDLDGGNIAILAGTTDITDNAWHHVVAVRDRSAGANGQNLLYVDGQLDVAELDAAYDAGFGSLTADLNIGYLDFNSTPSFYLEGGIDEVALYNRALTPDEIQDHYDDGLTGEDYCEGSDPFVPFPDATISLWDLDETSGSDYEDSFNGNEGTGDDDPTAVDGQIEGAQEFDGSTTGINVPADPSFNWVVDDSFSIEFWVKRNGAVTGDSQVAIGRSEGSPASSLIWWAGIGGDNDGTVTQNAASFVLGDRDGGNIAILAGTTDITDNDWHHVVAVRDRSAGANGQNLLYVDGQLDVAALDAAYDTGFGSLTADLNLGYLDFNSTPSFYLEGGIDEVALYDRALPQDEIQEHYDAGLMGKGIEDTLEGVAEIIGTWSSGIWYLDVAESKWTQMTADATTGDIAAGDFTGDGKADVASIWDNGFWYQDGDTLAWTKIPGNPPNRVTAGDVTGDGRAEIIGTWSSGIWYLDVAESKWTQMTADATTGDIAAGDFTGDGKADVASIWDNGFWYQDGDTLAWTKIPGNPPNRVTAGDVTGDGRAEIIGTWPSGIWYLDVAESKWTQMTADATTGDIAAGDFTGDGKADVASVWDNGFWYQDGDTLAWTKIPGNPPNNVTAGDVTGE